MSKLVHEDSLESRTQSIGTKRTSANSSDSNRPRKRRRNGVGASRQHSAIGDNNSTALADRDGFQNNSIDKASTDLNMSTFNTEQNQVSEMSDPSFGRNRLAMGFVRPQGQRQDSKSSGEITNDSSPNRNTGESSFIPIEISDDEMEESEGGMVINLEQDTTSAGESSDDVESEESGEIATTPRNGSISNTDATGLFAIDATPSLPMKKLQELSADELNEQLRYAFFHLSRDQIDLRRPVICLSCFDEGHLQHDCAREDTTSFRIPKQDPSAQIKLWISCCICASKSHLVGDCPEAPNLQAARWSLKSLDPNQIINLSLETGTKKLEEDAKNKGMRPTNLQIKGRAGLHRAGGPTVDNSSEDEAQFLRKPVGRQQANARAEPPYPQRYDRYDPPNQQSYRGGGQWYATDSFGRRRSRSPDDRIDSYRPRDDFNRSRVSPQRDSWRPPQPQEQHDTYRPRAQSPPRGSRQSNQGAAAAGPGSNIRFTLPTRKGSNPRLQAGGSGDSTPSNNSKPNGNNKNKAKYNRNKKKANRNG